MKQKTVKSHCEGHCQNLTVKKRQTLLWRNVKRYYVTVNKWWTPLCEAMLKSAMKCHVKKEHQTLLWSERLPQNPAVKKCQTLLWRNAKMQLLWRGYCQATLPSGRIYVDISARLLSWNVRRHYVITLNATRAPLWSNAKGYCEETLDVSVKKWWTPLCETILC